MVDPNNPKKCVDVDECASFGHNCSHTCSNRNGTYVCGCRPGFALSDQFSGVCRAESGGGAELLFSTGEEIRAMKTMKYEQTAFEVVKGDSVGRISGVDFDPSTMMVYWADGAQRAVKRSFIPGSDEQPEAKIGHPQTVARTPPWEEDRRPTDVSVDWVTGNIYWTEADRQKRSNGGVLSVATGDGRYRRDLITADLDRPTSVVVDPEHGLMYWTDASDDQPKIEVAWMDGGKRRAIVTDGLSRPESITVDFAMDHTIYWADSKLGRIEMMDHEGRRRHVVAEGSADLIRRPAAVDVFQADMFWANREDGSVVRRDKFGRGVPVVVARDLPNPKALKVVHRLRYNLTYIERGMNPCRKNTNDCSHLCVLVPGLRARCKCPNGQGFVDEQQTICDAGECKDKVCRWAKNSMILVLTEEMTDIYQNHLQSLIPQPRNTISKILVSPSVGRNSLPVGRIKSHYASIEDCACPVTVA